MDTPRLPIPGQLQDRMTMPEQHDHLRRQLTRRGVLRRGAAAAGTASAAPC